MLSKFSVKKPYTVVVGVVLIIILGIVSFTKTTVDLLPSIDMPYAIVMTSYYGASPEEVEQVVTRPLEQSMATVSNIKNVSSVSAENMSMVILEFEETANMDSATIEMRELIDQLKSFWDEKISNPIIMKINPDMLPVMITAVGVEGASGAEASQIVTEKVVPELESLEGVASVTATGTVTESIKVTMLDDKIAALGDDVKAKLDEKFRDAEADLAEARAQVENGKKLLEDGTGTAASGMASAQEQISLGELQLNEGMAEIREKEAEINIAKLGLQTALSAAQIGLQELEAQKIQLEQQIAQKDTLQEQLDQVNAMIEELEKTGQPVPQELLDSRSELEAALAGIAIAEALLPEVEQGIEEAKAGISQIEEQLAQITAGEEQLAIVKAQLQSGQMDLATAKAQMASGQIMAAAQFASGASQLAVGESQVTMGEEQLKAGKEEAYDSAAIDKILNKDMLNSLLQAQNFNMPAGFVEEDGIKYQVRVGDKFGTVTDLKDLVLVDLTELGAGVVKVSDIAKVEKVDDESEIYAKLNGESGILLSMQKQTGYSTSDVSKRILEREEKLQEEDPSLQIVTLMDQGIYIDYIVNSVFKNMLIGALLAILVLLLFLRSWRPTAIIACAIPLSVLTAIVCMYFSGVTINLISLSGLALGIGMLVDNAIVVIENIYRMRSLGLDRKEAAIQGAREMAGAIIASTLTTVCVFLPIVFTTGITRQLFVDMGLTIAFSLGASLLVALTLVPMMGAGMLKEVKEGHTRIFDFLLKGYEKLLRGALKCRWLIILGALILFLASTGLELSRGFSFMPSMESTQISITLKTPEGVPLEDTAVMADTAVERIMKYEDVVDVGAMTADDMLGGMTGGSSSGTTVSIYVVLKEDKELTNKELGDAIAADLEDLDCEVDVSAEMMDMSALGGAGISVNIKGRDLDTLQELAQQVADLAEDTKGCEEVDSGLEKTMTELRISVDKAKAIEHNLTVAQVFQQISAKIAEASASSVLSTDTEDYDIFIYDDTETSLTRDDIRSMMIKSQDREGKETEVALADIAEFSDQQTLKSIRRNAQSRYITVTAGISEDDNVTLVSNRLQKKLDKMDIPEGYSIKMAGEDETIMDAMRQLSLMMILAIVFMYLIMVAQFQSLKSPFIIMFTIPLAFTGGLLLLFLTGFDFSVIAMIGFVVLAGVIVNNGIVYVDYTNQLIDRGYETREALVEAGKTRMRPIMMTAITTILGLVTLALGIGMGTDMVQPMAIVVIGGLAYGTLLTLFVVPSIYDVFHNRKNKKKKETIDGSTEL